MPSSTPAGIFTETVRRARTRPSPAQLGHGCGITVPVPEQVGQGRLVITWPRNERWTLCTSPRPPQVSQLAGWVPGAVPAPAQVPQTTAVSTVRSRVLPKAVSASSRSSRISASAPCRTRLRGPRAVDAPKNASMMSPRPPKPPNGPPAGPTPPPGASGSPPRSTISRFCGSDRTSYAAVTSLNRSCAAGSGLTSGCRSRASFRYARLICSVEASRRTPSTP